MKDIFNAKEGQELHVQNLVIPITKNDERALQILKRLYSELAKEHAVNITITLYQASWWNNLIMMSLNVDNDDSEEDSEVSEGEEI